MSKTWFLKNSHVGLAPLESHHVDGNYQNWLNDEVVCAYNRHHLYPVSQLDLEKYVQEVAKDKNTLVLAIHDLVSGNHIGNISLSGLLGVNRSAELALVIGEKDYWGKGFARSASELIMAHGFSEFGLNRIWCGTLESNRGMRKLALSIGMIEEGVKRKASYKSGSFHDVICYSILNSEWQSQREGTK